MLETEECVTASVEKNKRIVIKRCFLTNNHTRYTHMYVR